MEDLDNIDNLFGGDDTKEFEINKHEGSRQDIYDLDDLDF